MAGIFARRVARALGCACVLVLTACSGGSTPTAEGDNKTDPPASSYSGTCEIALDGTVFEIPGGSRMCVGRGVAACWPQSERVGYLPDEPCVTDDPSEHWFGECEGSSNLECINLSEDDCYKVPGCVVNYIPRGGGLPPLAVCEGEPRNCNEITWDVECEQRGCRWTNSRGSTTSESGIRQRDEFFECSAEGNACQQCEGSQPSLCERTQAELICDAIDAVYSSCDSTARLAEWCRDELQEIQPVNFKFCPEKTVPFFQCLAAGRTCGDAVYCDDEREEMTLCTIQNTPR